MKGKKSLFLITFLIILGTNCYAVNDFKILTTPSVEIKTAFTIPTLPSLRNEGPAVSNSILLDFYSLSTDVSYYLTVNSIDTVLSFLTKPVSNNIFELGIGFKYHLYDYFKIFLENDFLFNQYYAFSYRNKFMFKINTGYNLKLTCFTGNKNLESIFYQTLFLGMDVSWNITKAIEVFAGFNSMSNFDFSLIGTPFYNLGCNFKLKENLQIGFDYEAKMIDMVAVVENLSEMLLTIYMKVSL